MFTFNCKDFRILCVETFNGTIIYNVEEMRCTWAGCSWTFCKEFTSLEEAKNYAKCEKGKRVKSVKTVAEY